MGNTTDAEKIADTIQIGVVAAGFINPAFKYLGYSVSSGGLATSSADLLSKINDGTATSNDYIDIVSKYLIKNKKDIVLPNDFQLSNCVQIDNAYFYQLLIGNRKYFILGE